MYDGAGEFGKAALSAVELQRSCDDDGGNAALRQQTEQRTLSLLQARQRSILHLSSMLYSHCICSAALSTLHACGVLSILTKQVLVGLQGPNCERKIECRGAVCAMCRPCRRA